MDRTKSTKINRNRSELISVEKEITLNQKRERKERIIIREKPTFKAYLWGTAEEEEEEYTGTTKS